MKGESLCLNTGIPHTHDDDAGGGVEAVAVLSICITSMSPFTDHMTYYLPACLRLPPSQSWCPDKLRRARTDGHTDAHTDALTHTPDPMHNILNQVRSCVCVHTSYSICSGQGRMANKLSLAPHINITSDVMLHVFCGHSHSLLQIRCLSGNQIEASVNARIA